MDGRRTYEQPGTQTLEFIPPLLQLAFQVVTTMTMGKQREAVGLLGRSHRAVHHDVNGEVEIQRTVVNECVQLVFETPHFGFSGILEVVLFHEIL